MSTIPCLVAEHCICQTESGGIAHIKIVYEHHAVDAGSHYIEVVDVQFYYLEDDAGKPVEMNLEQSRAADNYWRFFHESHRGFAAECELQAWAHWRKSGREAA